jgi:hypothetical protein
LILVPVHQHPRQLRLSLLSFPNLFHQLLMKLFQIRRIHILLLDICCQSHIPTVLLTTYPLPPSLFFATISTLGTFGTIIIPRRLSSTCRDDMSTCRPQQTRRHPVICDQVNCSNEEKCWKMTLNCTPLMMPWCRCTTLVRITRTSISDIDGISRIQLVIDRYTGCPKLEQDDYVEACHRPILSSCECRQVALLPWSSCCLFTSSAARISKSSTCVVF